MSKLIMQGIDLRREVIMRDKGLPRCLGFGTEDLVANVHEEQKEKTGHFLSSLTRILYNWDFGVE